MRYYDFSHSIILRNNQDDLKNNGAYIRIVHTATKSPDMDLYINDKLVAPDLRYREFTDYIQLPSGNMNLKVYPKNSKTNPLINSNINLTPNTISTFAIYSQLRRHFLQEITENPLSIPTSKKSKIRFSNLIENIPPIDIYLADGTLLYKNVNFKDLTNYIELPANTYIFNIKLADSDISILYVPNLFLNTDNYYTLYLIGLINDYHDPQILAPLDGITYINL